MTQYILAGTAGCRPKSRNNKTLIDDLHANAEDNARPFEQARSGAPMKLNRRRANSRRIERTVANATRGAMKRIAKANTLF